MKAEELRIGNYIIEPGQDDNKPFQVWGIYREDGNNKINNLPIAYFQPIPLTEEWLIKFGFSDADCKKGCIEITTGFTNFVLYKPNQEVSYDFYTWHFRQEIWPKVIELKYVHELQNLYFALTGTELTIK